MADIPKEAHEQHTYRPRPQLPNRPRWYLKAAALLAVLLLLIAHAACSLTVQPPATPTEVPPTATLRPSPLPTELGHTPGPDTDNQHTRSTTPLPSLVPSPTVLPLSTPAPPSVVETPTLIDLTSELSADLAYAHVKRLAGEIGPRPAGSGAENKARDYIDSTLQSYGYSTEQQPFTFLSFTDAGSSVTVTTPLQTSIRAAAMAAASSPRVTGDLVPVGLGLPSDYKDRDVAGKIVLIERGQITFREKAANAAAAGASGVIIYNNGPGSFQGSGLDSSSGPVVAISGEDGEQLRGLAEQGPARVTLEVKTTSQPSQAFNIVANMNRSAPRIIVGAHFDSVPLAPGANDNASGVAVLLEIARVLAKTEMRDEVAFVTFSGEELGLLGSSAYVHSVSQSGLQAINAMINLDMVGEGSQLTLLHRDGDNVAARIAAEARTQGLVTDVDTCREDSDHAPFARAGVSVFHFFTGIDPYYHTSSDTAEKVQPEVLARSAQAVLFVMEKIGQHSD